MRRLAGLLVVFLFVLTVQAAPEQVRQSVVQIYAIGYDSTGTPQTRWTGSGFAVGTAGCDSNTFLTNWHVITNNGEYPAEQVRLWILPAETRFGSKAEPVGGYECRVLTMTDGSPDVAVIQTLEPVSGYPALALRSARQVRDTTAVYAFGFTGLSTTRGTVSAGAEAVQITSGSVSDHLILSQAGSTWSLIHTAAIQHGFSGGPLVTEDGAAVGLNTFGFEENVSTELFCALFMDYAMELLDKNGIPYTASPGDSPLVVLVADTLHQPEISDASAYAAATLAAVLALAFAWYFLRTLREAIDEIRGKIKAKKAVQNFSIDNS